MSPKPSNLPVDLFFDTEVLRYLIAIVDENSLTRAAEKLYLSQPALSRYLSKIEASLGASIFFREHNQLKLTEVGAIFINAARSIVGLEDMCTRQLHLQTRSSSGSGNGISLMVQDIFYPFITDFILPKWQKTYPEVHLTVTRGTGDQVRGAIPAGRADLYIVFGSSFENNSYEAFVLGRTPMIIYDPEQAPNNACLSGDRTDSRIHCRPPLSSLPVSPAFLLCSHDTYLRELQERMLREAGIFEPQIAAEARLSVLIDLLPLGHGFTLLPGSAMKHISREMLRMPDTEYSCECLLAWQKGARLTPISKNLMNFLLEYWDQMI